MDKLCKHGHTSERNTHGQCIECNRIRSAKWRGAHPQYHTVHMRKYRNENMDEFNRRNREYYQRNKDRILLKMRCRKYGITEKAYLDMMASQNNACALCLEPFGIEQLLIPCVDHDHATGRIRGIIHDKCNKLLGLAGDNPDLLRKAIRYL